MRGTFENLVGRGENASNQHFLLFQHCFLASHKQFSIFYLHLFCCLQTLWIWTSPNFCLLVKSKIIHEGIYDTFTIDVIYAHCKISHARAKKDLIDFCDGEWWWMMTSSMMIGNNMITRSIKSSVSTNIPTQWRLLMPLGNKPFENTVGKGEIARKKQFLLFPQCFLPVWITFFHFRQIWNCCLQTLSV